MAKFNWDKLLHTSWLYTKIFFVVLALCVASYVYGTYKPNKTAIAVVNEDLDKFYMNKIEEMGLQEPEFTYNNDIQFIRAMHKCINYINFSLPKDQRVPYEMIIGQAALESGWGNSRFAIKANNLFGIRTWTESTPHLLPQGIEKWPGWGVRAFASKCDSVKEYVRLLNEHNAYKDFRVLRQKMLDKNLQLDSFQLIKTLDKFSTTPDYDKRVIRMINKIRKLEEKNNE
jgi:Bax protein